MGVLDELVSGERQFFRELLGRYAQGGPRYDGISNDGAVRGCGQMAGEGEPDIAVQIEQALRRIGVAPADWCGACGGKAPPVATGRRDPAIERS